MYHLLTLFEITAFISSIIAWQRIQGSNYMKLFPFLLFIIAAGELFGEFWARRYGNNTWFYNVYDPVMLELYFLILYFSIVSKRFKKFILVASIAYCIISGLTYYTYFERKVFNEWMYILGVFILIVCLIRKLYELLEDPETLDFLRKPFFYILVFTLLFYSVTIPNFAMNNWIASTKRYDLTVIVNNVTDFLNVLLYLAYTIIFLWIRKTGTY